MLDGETSDEVLTLVEPWFVSELGFFGSVGMCYASANRYVQLLTSAMNSRIVSFFPFRGAEAANPSINLTPEKHTAMSDYHLLCFLVQYAPRARTFTVALLPSLRAPGLNEDVQS